MKSVNLKIGNRILKEGCDPYIIAEIGVNHEGDFEKAKKLIYEAKEGGADAAKFQSYKASTLASKNSPSYWDTNKEKTKSQYELFKKFDSFNEKEYVALAEFCNSIDISFLSTPFDNESIDYLYPLVPFYKIASADITNVPFLRKVAKKNKPIILSTGASNLDEINFAIKTIKDCKNNEIGLLHCILNYPTNNIDANLSMITSLKEKYPDVYNVVETVASMQSESRAKQLEEKVKLLQEREQQLIRLDAEKELKAKHPDFDDVRNSDDFHDWAKSQPESIQNWIYKNSDDPEAASRAIDLFKSDMGITSKEQQLSRGSESKSSAADMVSTKTTNVEPKEAKIWRNRTLYYIRNENYVQK